jgi:hypothetical protein
VAAHDDVGDSFIGKGAVVINGYDYDFGAFHHPAAGSVFDRTPKPLFADNWGGVSAYRGSVAPLFSIHIPSVFPPPSVH